MIRIAVAGAGAIGSVVARALIDGIDGYELVAIADLDPDKARTLIDRPDFNINFVALHDIADTADWIVEALPAKQATELAAKVLARGKTFVAISASALLLHPETLTLAKKSGRILLPSGAIAGVDGITAMAEQGIDILEIRTCKKPMAYAGAPYILENKIDLGAITTRQRIFAGNALEAASAFPANVNVAATIALAARMDPKLVKVEAWADPAAVGNIHEITVQNAGSKLGFKIENIPSVDNPKSSALTALSIIALLRRQTASIAIP